MLLNYKILMPRDKEIVKRILDKLVSMGYLVGTNIYDEFAKEMRMDVLCVYTHGFTYEDGEKFPNDCSVLMEESNFAFREITDEDNERVFKFSEKEKNYYNDFKIVSWNDFLDDSFENINDEKEIWEFAFDNKCPYGGSFRRLNNGVVVTEAWKNIVRNRTGFIRRILDLIERESEGSNLS